MFQKLRARIAVAVFLLVASVVSRAAFHFMEISEVYSNASGTVQFIELNMLGAGQNQLFGRTISSTQGSNTNSFTFPNPNPGNAVAGAKILIGTVGYAALPGVPPPDYIIPNGFVFTSNVTINFAGAAFLTAPSIPTDGTLSIDRNGVTSTNSPTNNAGVSGTVVLAAQNTPPAAPTIISASGSDSTATIIFSAGSTGGSPIIDFTATCTLTSTTRMGTTTASPVVITGLANGNTYACTITARNAVGNSPASSPINVTPGSAPGAPTNVTGSAGNGSATLSFTAPQNTGGAPILNYTVNCGNAQSGTAQSSGPTSPITVSGLINGTTYSCTVAANNSVGTGPPSTAVNVTPALPGTVPDAPTITSAVPGNAQATISFTTPADGGNAITSYGVNCNSGQATARLVRWIVQYRTAHCRS